MILSWTVAKIKMYHQRIVSLKKISPLIDYLVMLPAATFAQEEAFPLITRLCFLFFINSVTRVYQMFHFSVLWKWLFCFILYKHFWYIFKKFTNVKAFLKRFTHVMKAWQELFDTEFSEFFNIRILIWSWLWALLEPKLNNTFTILAWKILCWA